MEYPEKLLIGAFSFLDFFFEKWYIHLGEQTHGQKLMKLKLKVIGIQGESGISK